MNRKFAEVALYNGKQQKDTDIWTEEQGLH